jgi:hypothetical protein
MSRFKRFFLLASITLAFAACAASAGQYPIATLQDGTFHHVNYDYSVVTQGGTGELMSGDWRLDNYAPAASGTAGLGEPKVTGPYVAEVGLDGDGDGEFEGRVTLPTFDLLFKHRRDDGRIFLSTFPISQHASERELSVMLRDFVESAAASGEITHNYNGSSSRAEAPMASRILASRPTRVHGFPAHEVVFEVANVQQLELSPSARWERGHVVLVRAEMVFGQRQLYPAVRVPDLGRGVGQESFYPVLMVVGYANHPDEFDAHHDEFRDFLSRIHIGDVWDTDALEAARAQCDIDQLDVMVSDGKVLFSSLVQRGDEMRCIEDALLAVRFPESTWMRTFSVRARPLRSENGATTAGEPIHAGDASSAPSTSGGENPVDPSARTRQEPPRQASSIG